MGSRVHVHTNIYTPLLTPLEYSEALSYVPTQVLDNESEEAGKLIDVSLPMFDPHELLEWLFVNERVSIDDEEIR